MIKKEQMFEQLKFLPRLMVIGFIRTYQKTLSPDHGFFKHFRPLGYCCFYPSCSEYSLQAVIKYGVIRGGMKSMWRILRCNPFNKGGFDPVK